MILRDAFWNSFPFLSIPSILNFSLLHLTWAGHVPVHLLFGKHYILLFTTIEASTWSVTSARSPFRIPASSISCVRFRTCANFWVTSDVANDIAAPKQSACYEWRVSYGTASLSRQTSPISYPTCMEVRGTPLWKWCQWNAPGRILVRF